MPVYIKKKVPVRKCSLYQAGKLWEFIYLRNVQTTKNVKKTSENWENSENSETSENSENIIQKI